MRECWLISRFRTYSCTTSLADRHVRIFVENVKHFNQVGVLVRHDIIDLHNAAHINLCILLRCFNHPLHLSYTRGVCSHFRLIYHPYYKKRKMRHKGRLPSYSHLLIAPKRGFSRPLLCKRFTCLLSRSETIHSLRRQQISSLPLQGNTTEAKRDGS